MEKFGQYILEKAIKTGGMASVHKARLKDGLGLPVVVKRIRSDYTLDPNIKAEFEQEAKLASKLIHRNIVKTNAHGEIDGEPYIELEYVKGTDLDECLFISRLQNRPLSVAESILIAIKACRGLAYAHGELSDEIESIVHRDISPHNILLDETGEVKISDFGIARLANSETIRNGDGLTGKLRYMSPEQIAGQNLDVKTDVFSLGLVLWEMLAGRQLFDDKNEVTLLDKRKSTKSLEPPSVYNPEVPKELDRLVMKALSCKPENRMTANELCVALDNLCASHNISREGVVSQLVKEFLSRRGRTGTSRKTKQEPVRTVEKKPFERPIIIGVLILAIFTIAVTGWLLTRQTETTNSTELTTSEIEQSESGKNNIVNQIQKFGELHIESKPWSEVFWQGNSLGYTAILGHKMPVGTHKIVLRNKPVGIERTIEVTIEEDKPTKVLVNLHDAD